ncbi:MAG: NADH-quinone oxidoreductase subunit C, partial [Nitrospinaceae bacterium]|nr:NADH-quinone oxidoreductase subunit C [Nitrospinaceae bacterium]NIR57102.1 NADH-quinone oxidoreductase subunit C [Nitrospinaceae bacterium]NIS87543.1 NADH-quinone oxidoreductase subunit C [Nitrospinaceae bacterium]NIT84413.1 NADH-quinone oxidoreductase subunit C [Nitrospinaceae bacterium]NIU46600.1 NADH-quinone oxidoreductase subunit C [Nitrospinaceae bacterium]
KAEVVRGDAVLHAAPEVLHAVARFLKEEPDLNFHYLSDLIGVDYLDQDRDPRFEAVYELHSFDHNHS